LSSFLVPQSARKVAKFHFKDLCEKQLSAVDFIAIAEHFHTVIVSDIPYFTLNLRDQMRRFILLIDELYQHQVVRRLKPFKLYPEIDLFRSGYP
jgi:cell division protein ZapE